MTYDITDLCNVQNPIQYMMFKGAYDRLPEITEQFQNGDLVLLNPGEEIYLLNDQKWEPLVENVSESAEKSGEQEEIEYRSNCCNCGAPLMLGRVCNYCGTDNIIRKKTVRRFCIRRNKHGTEC